MLCVTVLPEVSPEIRLVERFLDVYYFMADIETLRLKILTALACPVQWKTILPDLGEMLIHLERIWQYTARAHQVRDETDYFPEPECDDGRSITLELTDNVHELQSDLANIELWIDKARTDYERVSRCFRLMKLADHSDYAKHYARSYETRGDVIERSCSGVSIFFREFTPVRITRFMWGTFSSVWRHVARGGKFRYYADAIIKCGASHGEVTKFVCFDVDSATPLTHAYPIQFSEIPNKRKIIFGNDGLQ